MKILIDGRAFNNKGSSISIYLYNLLYEMFNYKKNNYVLVLNNKDYIKEFNRFKNISQSVESKSKNLSDLQRD